MSRLTRMLVIAIAAIGIAGGVGIGTTTAQYADGGVTSNATSTDDGGNEWG